MSHDRTGESSGTDTPANTRIADWIDETRSRVQLLETQHPSAPPRRRPLRHFRTGMRVLTGLAIIWFLVAWGQMVFRSTTELQGRVVDPMNRPIVGARVFLSTNHAIEAISGSDGEFRLSRVPFGYHSLVVVVEEKGEEYPFTSVYASINEIGTLPFHVPPQRVRQASGGGFGWTGIEP